MTERQINLQTAPGLWPPSWPMGLTMLRLLLLPVFLFVMLSGDREGGHPHRWVAVAIFAVMAITDKLDGYLARRLNQTTRLGAILDPVADKLLVGCSVILLTFDRIAPVGFAIPLWVAVAVYGKDLIVVVGTLALLSVVGKVSIVPRWLGKTSTAVQLSMVIIVLLAPEHPGRRAQIWTGLTQVLWWAVLGLAVLACADYLIQGFKAFLEDRSQRSA